MSLPYRARVNERTLLNLPGCHGGAYVYVYVEDTSRRGPFREPYCDDDCDCCPRNFEPRLTLEIADGDRTASFAFDLDTREGRRNSLHKLDTIVSALRVFRRRSWPSTSRTTVATASSRACGSSGSRNGRGGAPAPHLPP